MTIWCKTNRIVELWNSLPVEIRKAPSLEAFKFNVKKFLIYLFINGLSMFIAFFFYSIIYFNDVNVFNIHIEFILGDLSHIESSDS